MEEDENKISISNNELDLENIDISEITENDLNSLIDNDLDLNNINITEDIELESNTIIDNVNNYSVGLTDEQIQEFYDYLAGKAPRPIFAEKFFADGESRIRESNQLTTLMGMSFIPKLLSVQQSLVNSLCSSENLRYLSNDNKLSYLQTFAAISTKFNQIAADYVKQQRDFTGVPLIYRQLLDQLLQVSEEKLPRLKLLPKLIDLDDDTWNRIIEITNLK